MKTTMNCTSVLLLICLMGFSIFPNQIASVKAETVQYSQSASVTLGDSTENSYSRVAVHNTKNSIEYSTVDGNVPGQFTAVDYLNEELDPPRSYSTQDEQLYPTFLGADEYVTDSLKDNSWAETYWWVIDNTTTTPNKTGTFNVHYNIEVIGNLPEGTRKDFYITYPDQYYVILELSIDREGVYVLYLDNGSISNSILAPVYLISPDNLKLTTNSGSLPYATPDGNDPLQDYWTFIVPKRGVYRFYCLPLRNHFTGQLEQFSTLKKVTLKDEPVYLSYRDEASPEVYPGNYLDDFPVHIYSIEIEKGDYIHYELNYLWGENANPVAYIAVPDGNRYSYFEIVPDNQMEFQFMSFSGTVYIIIIHDDYFTWSSGNAVRTLLAYNLRLDKVNPIDLEIGGIDEIYVPAVPGHLLVRLTLTTPQLIFFNSSSIGTSPIFALSGVPFFFIHDTNGKTSMSALATVNSYSVFYFAADTYYAIVEYDGNGIDAQLLLLESHSTSISPTLSHVSKTKLKPAVFYNNKTSVRFDFFNNGTGSGAVLSPLIFPYTRESVYNLGYNLTVHRADNRALDINNPLRFRFRGRFYEISPYDGRQLIATNTYNSGDITLSVGSNQTTAVTRTAQIEGSPLSRRFGSGFLMIWPYNVQFNNGSGYVHYNSSVTFRIATIDQTKYFSRPSAPAIALHTMELTPSVNYTAVPYSPTQTLNLTEYDGIWLDITGRQEIDWWQFIFASNWSGAGDLTWNILFNNVWTSSSSPTHDNTELLVSSASVANHSGELGLPVQEFSLVLQITGTTEIVGLKMYLSEFDVPILRTPAITAKFVMTFSDWGPWVGVGVGGAAVLAVAAIIIIRKRRHWK